MDNTSFPQSEIAVTVCDHPYDAKGIFTSSTDTLRNASWQAAEMWGFKHNIQLTAHISMLEGDGVLITPIVSTGKIKFGIYFPTRHWLNPVTGNIEIIPNYDNSTYTSVGVAAFSGVTLGQAKAVRSPNHGQELFDVSNGTYGYDYVNGISGTNNGKELYTMVDAINSYFKIQDPNFLPKHISYTNGKFEASKMLMTRYLGGRNSLSPVNLVDPSQYDYGFSNGEFLGLPQQITDRGLRMNQACSSRWYDMGVLSVPPLDYVGQVFPYIAGQIRNMIDTYGGFFNDFCHWHSLSTDLYLLNDFFAMVNSTIGSDFVHRCSYGEALQYLFFREMISAVSAYEQSNKVYIVLQKSDPYKTDLDSDISKKIPYDLLEVPISVKVNLTGTYLAGKSIKTNVGTILSLGSNEYVIQIPFNNAFEGFAGVELSETSTPKYLSFALPAISSSVKSGTKITVVTNVPTKAVLYRGVTSAAESTYVVHSRSIKQLIHVFDITGYETGYNFKCGVISTEEQSILSVSII